MIVELEQVVAEAKQLAARFDADALDGPSAKRAVGLAVELERFAVALKTLAMRRVDLTGAWSAGADRSAERWLARVGGTSIGEAASVVATGERLEALSATKRRAARRQAVAAPGRDPRGRRRARPER